MWPVMSVVSVAGPSAGHGAEVNFQQQRWTGSPVHLLILANPLVKRDIPTDGTHEFTSAIMGFVFTHCAPWPEVVRASFNDQ